MLPKNPALCGVFVLKQFLVIVNESVLYDFEAAVAHHEVETGL